MGARTTAAIAIALCAGATAIVACSPALQPAIGTTAPSAAAETSSSAVRVQGERAGRLDSDDRVVRVALAGRTEIAAVSATGRWQVLEEGGARQLVRGSGDEPWRVERKGGLLRIAGDGGDATPWREGPFIARPSDASGMVRFGGKRYRGELWFTATDTGVLVVNRLAVEDYLRGVVPLEMGTRQPSDRAALEAQAIAARSYTYMRVPPSRGDGEVIPAAGWHMVATVTNQVYGGAEVEHALVDAAVDATAGLVIRYAGLIVDAPYSSSCGGRTAVPRDAWRDVSDEPYLRSLDDTDPRTGRPYCDISPRNHWLEEIDEARLLEVSRRALVAAGARDPDARVRGIRIAERTGSGRIGALALQTDRGDVTVRASDLRNVFRNARGAILFSTNFTVDRETRARGQLTGVTLRGAGNGHGVGMCQWGAIGRSRAGQDARAILRFYYPGTVVSEGE